jgi:hypothetical protein
MVVVMVRFFGVCATKQSNKERSTEVCEGYRFVRWPRVARITVLIFHALTLSVPFAFGLLANVPKRFPFVLMVCGGNDVALIVIEFFIDAIPAARS